MCRNSWIERRSEFDPDGVRNRRLSIPGMGSVNWLHRHDMYIILYKVEKIVGRTKQNFETKGIKNRLETLG